MAARLAGVHDTRPLAAVRSLFPATKLTRPFIGGVQRGPRSLLRRAEAACRPSWVAGLIPVYSLKLDYDEVMAGRWDGPIRELAAWHLDQPDAELIPWHEPENDKVMQGGRFVRYFNHLAAVWRSANTRTPLIYASMGYQWLPGRASTRRPADWQHVEADLPAIDCYSGQTVPLATILPEHRGFRRWHDAVVGDRDWGVAERGFITQRSVKVRAATIAREQAWLVDDPVGQCCRRYIVWNTSGTERNEAIVVDSKHGEPAIRNLIAALNDEATI